MILLQSLFYLLFQLGPMFPGPGMPAAGGATPINYGNLSGSNGSDSTGNNSILYGVAFTTGANAAGYTINSATIITGSFAGTAHYQFAVFPNTNPTTSLCQTASSTNVLASASTNTLTSLGTDCSSVTLAASTAYVIAVDNDNAAAAYACYTSGTQVSYISGGGISDYAQTPYGKTPTWGPWNTAAEYPKMYITVTPK